MSINLLVSSDKLMNLRVVLATPILQPSQKGAQSWRLSAHDFSGGRFSQGHTGSVPYQLYDLELITSAELPHPHQ